MSGHLTMRFEALLGQLTYVLETDPAHLLDAYSPCQSVDVDGFGPMDEDDQICEDCASEIRDDVDCHGLDGTGDESHCRHCGQALTFLADNEWIDRQLSQTLVKVDPEHLYVLELVVARTQQHVSQDTCDENRAIAILDMAEARLSTYRDNL